MGFGINETYNLIYCSCGYCLFVFIGCYGMTNDDIKTVLNQKNGNAFIYLEEMFWIDMLTNALEENLGNIANTAKMLGLDRSTLTRRIFMHGINVKRIKDECYTLSNQAKWRKEIKHALSSTPTLTAAAKMLGWNRTTLTARMARLGFK